MVKGLGLKMAQDCKSEEKAGSGESAWMNEWEAEWSGRQREMVWQVKQGWLKQAGWEVDLKCRKYKITQTQVLKEMKN